jgi:hypothetical protein
MAVSRAYAVAHTLNVIVYILFVFTSSVFVVKFEQPGTTTDAPYTVYCGVYSAKAVEPNGHRACGVQSFGDACSVIANRINELNGETCGSTPGYASFDKDLIVSFRGLCAVHHDLLCVIILEFYVSSSDGGGVVWIMIERESI